MTFTLLESPDIALEWELFVYDLVGNPLIDISDRLELAGSYIAREAEPLISGRAMFNLYSVAGLEYGRQRLRPYLTVRDMTGQEPAVRYAMGEYIMTPPDRPLEVQDTISVECTDLTRMLDVTVRDTFQGVKGTSINAVIESLVGLYLIGGNASIPVNIPPTGQILDSSPFWDPIEQRDASYGQIMSDLLAPCNFMVPYANRDGEIESRRYRDLNEIPPLWAFRTEEPKRWIESSSVLEGRRDPVPNVWIAVASASDLSEFISPVRYPNNDPLNPWSIPNQGVEIFGYKEFPVGTTGDLQIALKQFADMDRRRSTRVTFKCGPLPHLWHREHVTVNVPEWNLFFRPAELYAWTIPLDYGESSCSYTVDVDFRGTAA